MYIFFFFFSSRRRHTMYWRDWSSDVCSSDLAQRVAVQPDVHEPEPNDATPFLPDKRTLTALREAAAGCRGCHLWRGATQTVFGEGQKKARVMLVGEQPGDKEDKA